MEQIEEKLENEMQDEEVSQPISYKLFGIQHWMMLIRVESWFTMNNGEIEPLKMRTNYNKRPPQPKGKQWDKLINSTRLNDGTLAHDHDDWDCLEDLIVNDFVKVELWKNKKLLSLTEKGFQTFVRLRKFRKENQSLKTFIYE